MYVTKGSAPLGPTVLLVGHGGMLWPLPAMLATAGYRIEVLTVPGPHFHHRRHVASVRRFPNRSLLLTSAAQRCDEVPEAWVVIGDDDTLLALRDHPHLTAEQRMRLAPVVGPEHLPVLGSKIATLRRLAACGLPTPRFQVVTSAPQARDAAMRLGADVVVKCDAGSAGRGVIRCDTPSDAVSAWEQLSSVSGAQVMVEEALPGAIVDLSGIYRQGHLVHFTAAVTVERTSELGPGVVRSYLATSELPSEVMGEVRLLGETLGADGFTNVSCVWGADGSRHYFEADLRPTIWAAMGARVGDDPIERLRAWRTDGVAMAAPTRPHALTDRAAYFRRMRRRDLIVSGWRDVPWSTPDAVLMMVRTLVSGGDRGRG